MIELVPTGKAEVVKVATPFDTVPPPSRVEPLEKATEPVGVAEPVLAGVIVAVKVTDVPNGAELGEAVRAVVVAIVVGGVVTGNDADSMNPPPGLASPTATTVPLLRAATPLSESWAAPGFALLTELQLVPFHCSTTVTFSGPLLVLAKPTAKMLLAEVPEMATKSPTEACTTVQLVPLKFSMPAVPATQTSDGEIASTVSAASWPEGNDESSLHAVPLNCKT